MKIISIAKDGGKYSNSTGLFIVEIKSLFSIVLLRFSGATREAFHSHAFNAWTFWLRGRVVERTLGGTRPWRAGEVKYTPRGCVHKIEGSGAAYALSFRGPWATKWFEFRDNATKRVTLTNGRKEISCESVTASTRLS